VASGILAAQAVAGKAPIWKGFDGFPSGNQTWPNRISPQTYRGLNGKNPLEMVDVTQHFRSKLLDVS